MSSKKITFNIVGMHCTSCALTIDMDLEDLPGVKQSKTSYAKSITEVEYYPEQITVESLLSTISKSGYTAKA